jgi:PiT family inorganic phosphate transporter
MGVGATKRFSAVRWGLAGKIVMAWIFTLPICFAVGWVIGEFLLHL